MESTSSSFPSTHRWDYDVFLSFSVGEVHSETFIVHLSAALRKEGIRTFSYVTDQDIPKGEEILPYRFKAIEGSRISIVVFTEGYTHSTWCLKELVKIMECKHSIGQTFIPVFYESTDQAFYDPYSIYLKEAAYLSGCDVKDIARGNKSEFIEMIVKDVRDIIKECKYSSLTKQLEGAEEGVDPKEIKLDDDKSSVQNIYHSEKQKNEEEQEGGNENMPLDTDANVSHSEEDNNVTNSDNNENMPLDTDAEDNVNRSEEDNIVTDSDNNESMPLDTDPEDNVSHSEKDSSVTDSEEEEDEAENKNEKDDDTIYMEDGWYIKGALGDNGYAKGFELDDSAPPDGFRALQVDLRDPKLLSHVERLAKHAVNSYNENPKTKGELEFVEIDHTNICKGYSDVYFITLVAKDTTSHDKKAYQSRVSYLNLIDSESIKVRIFMPRPRISKDLVLMAGTSDACGDLDVENWSGYYIKTIQDWRENLKERSITVQDSNGQRVTYMELPPKNREPKFKEIVLKTSENTITLKIRSCDLYIVGYKSTNNGWFEFKESDTKNADREKKSSINKAEQTGQLIPGSTLLRYSGSYLNLEEIAGITRDQIQFSEEMLKNAINDLGKDQGTTKIYERKRAKAFLIIMIMIPEALRFQRILTLAENEPDERHAKSWIKGLTTDWLLLSKRIKKASKHPSFKFDKYTPENSADIMIETFEAACELVRLVKYEAENHDDADKNIDNKRNSKQGSEESAKKGKKCTIFLMRVLSGLLCLKNSENHRMDWSI